MTANGRPNLGGLFTGSTPPERSSTIADALDPPRVRARAVPPAAPPTVTTPPAPSPSASSSASSSSATSSSAPPASGSAAWWDPVNALGYYFDFLQGLFDANRAVTMAVATVITAPLRRGRSTR